MDREAIAGMVVILVCSWGCGALFYGIGIWAAKKKTPMHFWAGTGLDPKCITDIAAYNRENSRMWKNYSIPYWIAGVFGILGVWHVWFSALCGAVILIAGTAGIAWLIISYKRIEKKYLIKT